jgi:hypothetical protein
VVRAGLRTGEVLGVRGAAALRDGAPVKIAGAAAAPSAAAGGVAR